MSIFLLVLKIIGIILLSAVAVLLFLIALVLFVPVRYRFYANKPQDEDIFVEMKITWLIHFINAFVNYSKELGYRIRVTFITVYCSDNLKKSKKSKKTTTEDNSKKIKKEDVLDKINLDTASANEFEENDVEVIDELNDIDNFNVIRSSLIEDNTKEIRSEKNSDTSDSETDENEDKNDEKISIFKRICIFLKKIIDLILNFPNKIENCIIRLKKIYNKAENYYEIISDERNQEYVKSCIERIKHVLSHIAPKKIKGYLRIGNTDAYEMGKILSIYSILFPIIHDKIQVIPDYENEILQGEILIKGRIRVAVVLWAAYKIYFNKDLRRLKRMLNNVS